MELTGSSKNGAQHKARHAFAQRAEEKEVHPKVLRNCTAMKALL